jgi:diaminopimelate decarboxylase
MHHFSYIRGNLYAEKIPVMMLAKQYGTPLYIYSSATLEKHYEAFHSALSGMSHLICYSMKANSNLSVASLLGRKGAGADIVSGGELFRALKAGIPAEKIVYSGVGKREDEIKEALEAEILLFNVESLQELETISAVASGMGKTAQVGLRLNPDVDPKTHPYISTGLKENKFGLDITQSMEAYLQAKSMPGIDPAAIDCHIGSQLTSISPFMEALDKIMVFHAKLKEAGIDIRHLDLGGGLGIPYDQEEPPQPSELGSAVTEALKGHSLNIILEPGRAIAGNAGILVTKVLYTKKTAEKHFVIVDAAMNDLVRPSLYGAFHRIEEVQPHLGDLVTADVVGPICESGDFLAKDRKMPLVVAGECLAVFSAGAYGFTMSSQYNSRLRAAEILVDENKATLARKRESYADLVALETDPVSTEFKKTD